MTVQYFREQAIRAERLARAISDEKTSGALMELAQNYWHKADKLAEERTVTYDSVPVALSS